MKNIILTLTFFIPIIISGQELKIDEATGKYSKTATVDIVGLSKLEIYKKAHEWIALNYKSAEAVMQYADEESGKIIVKGNFPTEFFSYKNAVIKHTLQLDFKDGKFRYTFSVLYYSDSNGDIAFEGSIMSKKKLLETSNEEMNTIINNLTAFISKKHEDENW